MMHPNILGPDSVYAPDTGVETESNRVPKRDTIQFSKKTSCLDTRGARRPHPCECHWMLPNDPTHGTATSASES